MLSGNRNFEGRVNPLVRANYLASPPLVVAYALAGRVDMDLTNEPLGEDTAGKAVFLRDIWPTNQEVQAAVKKIVRREMFAKEYAEVFEGDAQWNAIKVPAGRPLSVGRRVHLHQARSLLRRPWSIRQTLREGLQRPARAGDAGRFGHHRPHFAGRQHRQGQPRRRNI